MVSIWLSLLSSELQQSIMLIHLTRLSTFVRSNCATAYNWIRKIQCWETVLSSFSFFIVRQYCVCVFLKKGFDTCLLENLKMVWKRTRSVQETNVVLYQQTFARHTWKIRQIGRKEMKFYILVNACAHPACSDKGLEQPGQRYNQALVLSEAQPTGPALHTTIKMFGCPLLLCRCHLWRSSSQLCYTNSIQVLCMRCNQGWSQRHKASFVPCNKLGCRTLHNLQPDLYHLVNREPVARATKYGTKRISSWTNDGSRQISLISNYRSSLAELQYDQSMTRSVQPKGLVRSNYLAR